MGNRAKLTQSGNGVGDKKKIMQNLKSINKNSIQVWDPVVR